MQSMTFKHSASAVCFLLLCLITEAKRDYYNVIDVPQSASTLQIKKAFHKLAMKYHPDKNNSPDAEVIFTEIVEAYEVLSNDVKRQRYDELGHKDFKEDFKDKTTFGANIFRFSFEEFFQGLGLDDDLFLDSPEDTWSFQMGDVDQDDTHQVGSVFDSDFFDFLGADFNEMSLDPGEDGFQDLEPSFCWIKTHSDGSSTRVCEED
ncbi:dnaJ homolog subfamily B member 9 isoform X2 [Conger conger]|nr:dnaJ homolog subfamily B member 9 isoform X2 [Conger conger]XP_061115165.1 dnaJ homolog subfamily B member 9 isoform X2 [Conger conger]